MATAAPETPQAKTAYKVIDADTHLTEPHDMWTRRAPAAIRDYTAALAEAVHAAR